MHLVLTTLLQHCAVYTIYAMFHALNTCFRSTPEFLCVWTCIFCYDNRAETDRRDFLADNIFGPNNIRNRASRTLLVLVTFVHTQTTRTQYTNGNQVVHDDDAADTANDQSVMILFLKILLAHSCPPYKRDKLPFVVLWPILGGEQRRASCFL